MRSRATRTFSVLDWALSAAEFSVTRTLAGQGRAHDLRRPPSLAQVQVPGAEQATLGAALLPPGWHPRPWQHRSGGWVVRLSAATRQSGCNPCQGMEGT